MITASSHHPWSKTLSEDQWLGANERKGSSQADNGLLRKAEAMNKSI